MWLPFAIAGVSALGVGVLALSQLFSKREYTSGLIIGDSMLATPIFTNALRRMTGIEWQNVAVVGRNSAAILRQLQRNFRPGVHDVVVASVGGNDGDRSLRYTQENISAIARTVEGAGADLVLLTEPPMRDYARANRDSIARNEASRRWVASGATGARYVVDLHRLIGDGRGHILDEFDAGDGLHPNRRGRLLIARRVVQRIT